MLAKIIGSKPAVDQVEKKNVVPEVAFDYKNSQHLELIQDKINQFSNDLLALQAIDYKIFMGAAIGTGCYFGSYIFPLVLFSIAGACMASWNGAKREQVSAQYHDSLHSLIAIYQWSMGKDTGKHWEKLAVDTLQNLIRTLGPWVSNKTIHTWSTADLKPGMLSFGANRRADIPQKFEEQLMQFAANTQTAHWAYRLYGEEGIGKLYEVMQTNITSQVNDLVAKSVLSK